MTRDFPTSEWERFDYVEDTITVSEPVSYDLELEASFVDTYAFDNFKFAFSVFDEARHPIRSKEYEFKLKDRDGKWKSELVDGCYHFRFPINSELSLNEPGHYIFQLENKMYKTPLVGIKNISIISK